MADETDKPVERPCTGQLEVEGKLVTSLFVTLQVDDQHFRRWPAHYLSGARYCSFAVLAVVLNEFCFAEKLERLCDRSGLVSLFVSLVILHRQWENSVGCFGYCLFSGAVWAPCELYGVEVIDGAFNMAQGLLLVGFFP